MRILIILALLLSLVGCSGENKNTVTVGTIAGPESSLVAVAQQVAKDKYGVDIKVIEFNDYNLPNEALQDGSLDVNVYQHLPYLRRAKEAHGYNIMPIGKTFVYPMAVYSKKYNSLDSLPPNALIAIPNDPSNESRALLLLQRAGLIKLKHAAQIAPNDIIDNPKHLRFKELDAAHLPRVLPDVDAAVINTTFALLAGLEPTKNSLFVEDKDSPYANLIVIRSNNNKREKIDLFVKAMNSDEVKQKAKSMFGDAAIAAW